MKWGKNDIDAQALRGAFAIFFGSKLAWFFAWLKHASLVRVQCESPDDEGRIVCCS
jgi:hypothetical protein